MKRLSHALIAFVFTASLLSTAHAQDTNAKKPNLRETPIVKAVRKAKPSVVTLKITRHSAYSTREVIGSGVVFEGSGYVVTNRHVVASCDSVKAVMADGSEYAARVLVEDARHDLAIVKLVGAKNLPVITFAPASDLMEGETVIAIGHPYGYVNTVSTGIISALGREIVMPTQEKLTGLIQVTASINPGNSGGPLLNIYGDLIGINVAMRDGAQNIAFALNADSVQVVLAQHLRAAGVEHGLKCREAIVPNAETSRQQVVVEETTQKSLKSGDVILTVADRKVTNRFELERSLWGHKAGEVVTATVVRDGKEMPVALTLSVGRVAAADTTPQFGSAEATTRPVVDR